MTPRLIPFDEALRRCHPGGGEEGFCLGCKVHAPQLPFGSSEEAICYCCALRLAPAHPALARMLEPSRRARNPILGPDFPF